MSFSVSVQPFERIDNNLVTGSIISENIPFWETYREWQDSFRFPGIIWKGSRDLKNMKGAVIWIPYEPPRSDDGPNMQLHAQGAVFSLSYICTLTFAFRAFGEDDSDQMHG